MEFFVLVFALIIFVVFNFTTKYVSRKEEEDIAFCLKKLEIYTDAEIRNIAMCCIQLNITMNKYLKILDEVEKE